MKPKQITIKTPLFKIAAQCWGKPSAHPVLALHGWLDNSNSFLPIAPFLEDFYIVAIDILGHGLSDHRPKGSVYHFLDAVPPIIDVMDALKWEKLTLLGHSMGAGISTLVAGTFPERIHKLVLIEALGPISREPDEVPAYLLKHIQQARELLTKKMPLYKSKDLAAKARKIAGDLSLDSCQVLAQRGLKKVAGGYTWRTDPRLRLESPLRLSEPQVIAFLKRIQAPTLYISAEKGLPWGRERQQQRAKAVPDMTQKILPGGHHLHMDTPELVARTINAFLKSP